MCNDIVTIWGCILNVIGTIYAVLCIIKMSINDVLYTRTAQGLDNAEFSVLEQRYYARVGIGVIMLGAIVQIIAIIFKAFTWKCMLALISITFFIVIIWVIEERKRYSKEKEKIKNMVYK